MRRVLVIEDQPQMRRNLLSLLLLEGYQTLDAPNGRIGIEIAKRERPDLILCDVMMPEMDGFAVLQSVRGDASTATIPFIFLTARGEKVDVRAGMNLGADDYLTKPAGRQELLAAISARLERAEAHAAQAQIRARGFHPDFSSSTPLEGLGITTREAQVLLWVAQGKSNADISIILGMAEATVKRHLSNLFEKLGIESRHAATLRALDILTRATAASHPPENHGGLDPGS